MATYYDGLNYVYKSFAIKPPACSAQLVMLHLLHENNRSGNSGSVTLADRELALRTSLNRNTVTEAKRTLKNRGLIDFKRGASGTIYTLKFFAEPGQEVGQRPGQQPGQRPGQQPGQRPGNAPSITPTLNKKNEDRDKDDGRARESLENFAELDDALNFWEEYVRGGKLTVEHQSELAVWLKRYGSEFVRQVMKTAADSNGNPRGVSFNFFKAILLKKIPKGGDTTERTYRKPRYTGKEPWAEYDVD